MKVGDRVIATFPDGSKASAGEIIAGPIARDDKVIFKVRFADLENWVPAGWLNHYLRPVGPKRFLAYAYNPDHEESIDSFIGEFDTLGDAFFESANTELYMALIYDEAKDHWDILPHLD